MDLLWLKILAFLQHSFVTSSRKRSKNSEDHWTEWISSGQSGEVCSIVVEGALGQSPNRMDNWLVKESSQKSTYHLYIIIVATVLQL